MQRPTGYNEVNVIGAVNFTACTAAAASDICIEVAEAWDDGTPRRDIILSCAFGYAAEMYRMDPDKAEALGMLIVAAARGMRRIAQSIDEDARQEASAWELSEDVIKESAFDGGLSVRARKVLRRALNDEGITSLEKLTVERLQSIKHCGQHTVAEIRKWIEARTQDTPAP